MAGIRTRTRALLVQALYQAQLTDHGAGELKAQFRQRQEFARVDSALFDELLDGVFAQWDELRTVIGELADRPGEQIDPVEYAILLLAMHELSSSPQTPFRVVINEAVSLAHRFGAEDGHKYVNAVLDKAAQRLRPHEQPARHRTA